MRTERLVVRPPVEADRERFVALFRDPEFMVFSAGVHDLTSAHERFDGMLANIRDVPFAKQPIVDPCSNAIVGYAGAAWFEFEGTQRLEFGYRLVPEARGRGYAIEAACAVLDLAVGSYDGEILAIIDPANIASQG